MVHLDGGPPRIIARPAPCQSTCAPMQRPGRDFPSRPERGRATGRDMRPRCCSRRRRARGPGRARACGGRPRRSASVAARSLVAPPSATLASRPPAQSPGSAWGARAGDAPMTSVARVLARAGQPGGRCQCGGTIGASGCATNAGPAGGQTDPTLALHSRPSANDALARMLSSDVARSSAWLRARRASWTRPDAVRLAVLPRRSGRLPLRLPRHPSRTGCRRPTDPQNKCSTTTRARWWTRSHQYAGCPAPRTSTTPPRTRWTSLRDSGRDLPASARPSHLARARHQHRGGGGGGRRRGGALAGRRGSPRRSRWASSRASPRSTLRTGARSPVPARSARHLRVMGMLLHFGVGSPAVSRRWCRTSRGPRTASRSPACSPTSRRTSTPRNGAAGRPRLTAERLGTLSMHELIEFLGTRRPARLRALAGGGGASSAWPPPVRR